VEDLEAGAGERRVDRIEAEQRDQLGVRVPATSGIVDEHVELDLAHAGVQLVGQRPVRVLEPVGRGAEGGAQHRQERRLGLDVVAVVRRQDLDLVDGDLGPPAVAARAAAHGDRPAGAGQEAHERQGGEEEDEARLAADHPGSLSGRGTVPLAPLFTHGSSRRHPGGSSRDRLLTGVQPATYLPPIVTLVT
jgi:hypothetical protein